MRGLEKKEQRVTKLLRYLRSREWAVAVLALAFIVVQVWLDLKSPE